MISYDEVIQINQEPKMERERITISIKKDLLDKVDSTIDGVGVRNRSHALENLISVCFGAKMKKNAVILVGGKSAVKSIPEVKEMLFKLKDAGYEKVQIALGSLAEKIKESLGNGKEFGLVLEYVEEGEGTGGALLPLKRTFRDTFLAFNPGNTFPGNIDDLISFHKKHGLIATVATSDLPKLDGTYILEPKIYDYIPKDFSMLEEDIFPKLAKENQLAVFPMI